MLQEIKSSLQEADKVITNQIESSFSKFKRDDEMHSNALVKHIIDDAELCGKYDSICDLRKSAIEEFALEVRSALDTQRVAIRHCLTQFNNFISNSTTSAKSDYVSPIKMETDKSKMSINQYPRSREQSQKATIALPRKVDEKQKWKMDKNAHEMRILAQQNRRFDLSHVRPLWRNHFNRSLRKTYSGKINALFRLFPDLFDVRFIDHRWIAISKVYRCSNDIVDNSQLTIEGQVDKLDSDVPNISGVWVYASDNQMRIVLKEDTITGHVTGIMVLNNESYETQCSIQGDRKVDHGVATSDKPYYRLCKIYPNGNRRYHSVYLGPNRRNISIFKDEDTKSEVVVLENRQIQLHFQEQMKPVQMNLMKEEKEKEVENTTVNVDSPIVHKHLHFECHYVSEKIRKQRRNRLEICKCHRIMAAKRGYPLCPIGGFKEQQSHWV